MHAVAPEPVKLVVGTLYSSPEPLKESVRILQQCYGPTDMESVPFNFTVSDYYFPEMGSPLFRKFYSFAALIQPDRLAAIKTACNEIEDSLRTGGKRNVNLDPGYLDYDKLVLASAKYNGSKVYLAHGIWADLTLHYEKGNFRPYPWSFPDFKNDNYYQTLLSMRSIYKKQLRNEL